MNNELFRARIIELRERQHKSRVVVSELCGLPSDSFRRYERGEAVPTVESMLLIAKYFGVSMDYLTGRTSERGHFEDRFD